MGKAQQIANWGMYPQVQAKVAELGYTDELQTFVKTEEELLARGNGRCYGDAALSTTIFSTLKLNKILSFDPTSGVMACQAGVLLSSILEVVVPKGFFLPVTPGTKFITIGGAIAADVHGKNHHSEGCFSDHVLSFDLMLSDGQIITCARNENPDWFWATVGGMGLTGIIVQATFQLKPIETAYIRMESIKAQNLAEIMSLFEASEDWTYTVSWIDCLQKGKHIGRSIMMRGEHATIDELPPKFSGAPLSLKPKMNLNVPFQFPSFALNTLSVKAFNFLYYHKQRQKQLNIISDYDTFFYPLDAIHNWNRIYGKKGFTQYQFVIPKEVSREGLEEILRTIAASGQGSFLAVLKLFGKNNPEAYNSFPFEGYTLALDFKINRSLPKLIAQLDELVQKYQGRIYLAKDAFSVKHSDLIIPNLPENRKFTSLQQTRLATQA
ncbi:MAG: FAD-binding oxidoreductase [Bacteroidota bacterium]